MFVDLWSCAARSHTQHSVLLAVDLKGEISTQTTCEHIQSTFGVYPVLSYVKFFLHHIREKVEWSVRQLHRCRHAVKVDTHHIISMYRLYAHVP